MAEGINVRFAGELQRFIQQRIGKSGFYASASEYIRDLVRRDYEREEEQRKQWLRHELRAGLAADEADFELLNAEDLIAAAEARKEKHGR